MEDLSAWYASNFTLPQNKTAEVVQIDPRHFSYDSKNQPSQKPLIDEAFMDSLATTLLKNTSTGRKLIYLFESNREFFVDMMESLFWVTHITMHEPYNVTDLTHLLEKCGKQWVHFLFPIQTRTTANPIYDEFVRIFPFFTTQVFHYTFLKLSNGHKFTRSREFRASICSVLIHLFTTIDPIPSLVENEMMKLFHRLPQADVPDCPVVRTTESLTLPVEDLTTLKECERRERAIGVKWKISGVSPIIAAGTGRASVPYEPDNTITLQYPKAGEHAWTTDLPPLMPPKHSLTPDLRKSNYNPMKEPRSLLARSRRTDTMERLKQMKASQKKMEEQLKKDRDGFVEQRRTLRKKMKERSHSDLSAIVDKMKHSSFFTPIKESDDLMEMFPSAERPSEMTTPMRSPREDKL